MLHMDSSEIYFRGLDRLVARENFLEKEMLDSDVRHLEVRTGFFDKSLAVGISFMTSGYQRVDLEQAIHRHLFLLLTSLFFVLSSFLLCVVHNFLISRAVHLLSKQLERVYHSANKATRAYPDHVNKSDLLAQKIRADELEAGEFAEQKTKIVSCAHFTGLGAVILLIIGYCIGLAEVASIIAATK
jgi:hypothetical protein